MTQPKAEYKWIIDESRIGPSNELVILIPRVFPDDDDWYFLRSERKAIPAFNVFNTPQGAAEAFARIVNSKIQNLKTDANRVMEWAENLSTRTTTGREG